MGGAVEELQRPQTHLDLGYVMLPNLANFGHEPPLQKHHSAPACVHCLAKWQGKVGQSGESVQPSPSPSRSAASGDPSLSPLEEGEGVWSSFLCKFCCILVSSAGERVSSLAEGAEGNCAN